MVGYSGLNHYRRFLTKWNSSRKLQKEPVTIILAPHLDDIFLSLNSLITSREFGRNIVGINIFTLSDSLVDTKVEVDLGAVADASLTRLREELDYAQYL